MSDAGGPAVSDFGNPAGSASRGRVSFLDQALWKRLSEAKTLEGFAQAWLGLQCRWIGPVTGAVVLLGEPDEGPFMPAAFWPDEEACGDNLRSTVEQVLKDARGVLRERGRDGDGAVDSSSVGYPIHIDGRLHGAVAVELPGEFRGPLQTVFRQLQWGAAGVEAVLRREEAQAGKAHAERIAQAFDLIGTALEQPDFTAACNAAVTELAIRLNCDLVSIGFIRGRRNKVVALSHAAQFGERMNLVRSIGAAMDEAVDQKAPVLYPHADDWDFRIDREHAHLARSHDVDAVLTIPLHLSGRFLGALTFERRHGEVFDQEAIEFCDGAAAVIGPILEEKRRNSRLLIGKIWDSLLAQLHRLIGPRYIGRKLAVVGALAAVAFFAVVKDDYRVTSPAVIEGGIQRTISAPIDGYIASEQVRAGQVVRKDTVLAKLDDRDLVLERLRAIAERNSRTIEYDRALAAHDRAKAGVFLTDIQRAEAQIALLDAQIDRAELKAPFDGLVISGDLSQMVGASMRRGDEMFKLAPLDSYRVILKIDERDIADVEAGQRGRLFGSALPDKTFDYTVRRITPVAEAAEGRNYFRVEAVLDQPDLRLRPGMSGIGKTDAGERLLIRIWTERLVDWIRITLWRWLP
jgi:multidrug efflux pump subunit AcrA (membrane-fusion protein)